MLDAIDVTPVYQQVAYEVAPAAYTYAANGSAVPHIAVRANAQKRVTDARIHCVVSNASRGEVAVCDNATLISLSRTPAAHGVRPAALRQPASGPDAAQDDGAGPVPAAYIMPREDRGALQTYESPTRRWLADLLLTAGIGLLLVSCFLFITSRIPLPARR